MNDCHDYDEEMQLALFVARVLMRHQVTRKLKTVNTILEHFPRISSPNELRKTLCASLRVNPDTPIDLLGEFVLEKCVSDIVSGITQVRASQSAAHSACQIAKTIWG